MPEGHQLHRAAAQQRQLLGGTPLRVDSPQGRFAQGAARLDGRVLCDVQAHGKHLLYHWQGEPAVLHVHLGLYGNFRVFEQRDGQPLPEPTPGTRLRMIGAGTVVHLAGPSACELLDPPERDRLLARLGPDPLRPHADPQRAWEALQRRTVSIAAALLDQRVISGVGNVFRAEALFVERMPPDLPAQALRRDDFDRLWNTLSRFLHDGVREGRIITVDPADVGAARVAEVPDDERVYVYRREGLPCRRCGTPVQRRTSALRSLYFCPTCQRHRPKRPTQRR